MMAIQHHKEHYFMNIALLRLTSSQPIVYIIRFVCLVCLSFLATSCYGPYHNKGYKVSIHIDKSASPTMDDITLITDYLDATIFEVVSIKEESSWKVESYKIKLNENKFKDFKHKYIMFVVAYSFTSQLTDNQKLLERIDIRIGNSWEGKQPILKKEIDLVANQIAAKLDKRFGESNFSVERKIVTPM